MTTPGKSRIEALAKTGRTRVWAPVAWLYYIVGPSLTLAVLVGIGVLFGIAGFYRLWTYNVEEEELGGGDVELEMPEEIPAHLRRRS